MLFRQACKRGRGAGGELPGSWMGRRAETRRGKLPGATDTRGLAHLDGILDPTPGDDQTSRLGYFHGGLRRKDCPPPPPPSGSRNLSFCLGTLSITLGGERKLFQKPSKPRVLVVFWSYFWWGKGKAGTPPSGPGVSASQHYHSARSPLQFLLWRPQCRSPEKEERRTAREVLSRNHKGLRGIG